MRNNALRQFRLDRDLTQKEMATKLGTKLQNYALLENGARKGLVELWLTFQKVFNVDDSEMWRIVSYPQRAEEMGVHDLSEKQAGARCRHI